MRKNGDPVGEQRQWDDDGDVVMGRLLRKYVSRLRLAASLEPQAREEAETTERRRWASDLGKLISTTLFLHVHPKLWTDLEQGGA